MPRLHAVFPRATELERMCINANTQTASTGKFPTHSWCGLDARFSTWIGRFTTTYGVAQNCRSHGGISSPISGSVVMTWPKVLGVTAALCAVYHCDCDASQRKPSSLHKSQHGLITPGCVSSTRDPGGIGAPAAVVVVPQTFAAWQPVKFVLMMQPRARFFFSSFPKNPTINSSQSSSQLKTCRGASKRLG